MTARDLPCAEIFTAIGVIEVELNVRAAPLSAWNFLKYIDEGRFDGASFYRTMRREHWTPGRDLQLIQGGLGGDPSRALPPIAHESGLQTGLRHLRGALSYARAAPGTAGSEFFICLDDCPGLDPTDAPVPPADGLGYAVFGRVVSGMGVAERIHASETAEDAPLALLRGQVIKQPVVIIGTRRARWHA